MKRITLLLFLILYAGLVLNAQEPLKHEKRVFVSPEGTIYINKSLPIYLRLSSSPDKKDPSYLLHSETTPSYANPMYLDQEGYNSIRSPWAVDTITKESVIPPQYIVYEVYADSKPPVTTIHYDSVRTFPKAGTTFVNKEVRITLKAIDEISGVENIYYSLDGNPYQVYKPPLNLNLEKEYTLKYYAADQVGNSESPHTVTVSVDMTRPQSTVEVLGPRFENTVAGGSKIALHAEDKGIGVDKILFRIDDGIWQKYPGAIPMATLNEGDHKINYYATDLTGNEEDEKTFEFYVDKTAPVMVQELIGRNFVAGGKEYASGKNQIKLTTFDNKAGVKEVYYSINNTDYVKYEKPFSLSGAKGDLLLKAYAVDNVGNKTTSFEKGESLSFPYIDLSGPVLSHSFSGPTFTIHDTLVISSNTRILLKATDNESGVDRIEYAINGRDITTYSGPFSIENEGLHSISLTGFDHVENTSMHDFYVLVDNSGPAISSQFSLPIKKTTLSSGMNIPVFPSHLVVFLACTDETVGFDAMYYTLNTLPEKKYAGLITNFLQSGMYTLKIRALDKLGNESLKEISFIIE